MIKRPIPAWMFDKGTVKSTYMCIKKTPKQDGSGYNSMGFDSYGHYIALGSTFTFKKITYLDLFFENWPDRTPEEDVLFELEFGEMVLEVLQKITNEGWYSLG